MKIRVYYIDGNNVLQEHCWSADKGCWFAGEIGAMCFKACPDTRLGALEFGDQHGGVHIRVYCQGKLVYTPAAAVGSSCVL